MRDTLGIILAGGQGNRLSPLTKDRAKPAVPFGGIYRIIDFTLSNCINSNLRQVYVLSQYKSSSLERHIRLGWNILSPDLGEFITCIPPQQRVNNKWYQGTADAIYQNLYNIRMENPRNILILSGDHIYKMDYGEMLNFHLEKSAALTIAAIEVPTAKARGFGIIEVDENFRVSGFQEKPDSPSSLPHDVAHSFASMGIYIFNAELLYKALENDSCDETSEHDFGKSIIPKLVAKNLPVYAYNFKDENKKEAKYWRDVGTIDAYWNANMDLVNVDPVFNLYDTYWPIRTYQIQAPPAKTVFAQERPPEHEGHPPRIGITLDSMIAPGAIVSGGWVKHSIISPNVKIHSYSRIENSVLFSQVEVGRYSRIKNTIIDKYVKIPRHTVIGENWEEDIKRFKISEGGIRVVPKGMVL
ncbi:MAG: glucose-1-phosphate adenylyltransferase [bacterium]